MTPEEAAERIAEALRDFGEGIVDGSQRGTQVSVYFEGEAEDYGFTFTVEATA